MDQSAAKAYVDREIEPLLQALGISHWRVNVSFGACSNPEWCGSCGLDPDYNIARIRLDPAQHANEEELGITLRHELFHILLGPFETYREAVTQHLAADSNEAAQDSRFWTHFLEQAVINLERLWSGARKYEAAKKPSPSKPGRTAGTGRSRCKRPRRAAT